MPKQYEEPVAGKLTVKDNDGNPVKGKGDAEIKWGTREHAEHVIQREGGSILHNGEIINSMDDVPSEAEYNAMHKRGADRREATGGSARDAVSAPVVGSEPKGESKSR